MFALAAGTPVLVCQPVAVLQYVLQMSGIQLCTVTGCLLYLMGHTT